MARVNLEERLFADKRIEIVGKRLRKRKIEAEDQAKVLGFLALIWRNSQDEKKVRASAQDIAVWLGESEVTEAIKILIEQLVWANFLKKAEENSKTVYEISGNEKQLDAQKKWKERSKAGGEANRKRIEELARSVSDDISSNELVASAHDKPQASLQASLPDSLPDSFEPRHIQFNSIQFDSIGFDAKQSEAELINSSDGASPPGPTKNLPAVSENFQKPKKSKSAGEASHGSQVWEAYSIAYEQRMRVKPIRNAKQNALCAQLVQRLGVENAVKCAVFYLSHPGQFYMQQKYPLGLLVKDCEGIFTEFQRGEYVTIDKARRASISEQNNGALERFLERERKNNGL